MSTQETLIEILEFQKELIDSKDIINSYKKLILGVEYAGLNIEEMAITLWKVLKEYELDERREIICSLLGLLFLRGPNVANLKPENCSNVDSYKKIKGYSDTLGIKSKADKNPKALTLPRLCLIFPLAGIGVWSSLKDKITVPISDGDLGISNAKCCYPNFVPCLIKVRSNAGFEAMALMIHCLYQIHLSHLVQAPSKKADKKTEIKPLGSFIVQAFNFVHISWSKSIVSDNQKIGMTDYVKKAKIDSFEVVSAMNEMAKLMERATYIDAKTTWEWVFNYLIKTNVTDAGLKEIAKALETKPLTDIKIAYPWDV
ncbi:nucleoprotein [Fitzroy Crossing tenui-like virus 1]|uniref:Nucleoprotein n=1 Tax=Fitzroy Crossing tenui-like virus 1 TaxID=2755159 RepID=A0A7D5Y1A6_9VIRU|nr:nucleoprotein [Fitzroy Crossing tenui-like virus 1]QLJ83472.1 nucleoprotein [Fitzroy Crossing tenui-like virus 1]